jgi:hypothetical protein
MTMNTRVSELAQKQIDFSKVTCFPAEIQAKLGDPRTFQDPDVLHFLLSNSEVCRVLYKNPADFEMLEMAYFGTCIRSGSWMNGVDHWLIGSLPGKALRDRLTAVSVWLADHLRPINNGRLHILDLGAGPGPYAFATLTLTNNKGVSLWDCIDADRYGLAIGEVRARESGLQHLVKFRQTNFMSKGSYPMSDSQRADFGLLIGILCGMTEEVAVDCLQKIKPHFKPGAEILAATLLVKSFQEEPTVFRILCNILGWPLRPKTLEEVMAIFKSAGYEILSIFTERDNGDGEYAIVHARI